MPRPPTEIRTCSKSFGDRQGEARNTRTRYELTHLMISRVMKKSLAVFSLLLCIFHFANGAQKVRYDGYVYLYKYWYQSLAIHEEYHIEYAVFVNLIQSVHVDTAVPLCINSLGIIVRRIRQMLSLQYFPLASSCVQVES